MYTVNELRKFLAGLQDDDVAISLALEFTRDALSFEEQPLLVLRASSWSRVFALGRAFRPSVVVGRNRVYRS